MPYKRQVAITVLGMSGVWLAGATHAAPIVANPGFEDNASSFTTFPGYTFQAGNTTIASWTTVKDNTGINPGAFNSSPFAPAAGVDSGNFAFLQGATSAISQVITGFVIGTAYTLQYDDSTRNGNTGGLTATIDTASKATTPSTQVWTTETLTFVATATTETLTFTNSSGGGDNTVNVDNVSVPEPASIGVLGLAGLGLLARRRTRRA